MGFNLKWQPNQDNQPFSFEKVWQGFYESGYSPYFYLRTFAKTKYTLLIPQIAIGGYSQKLNLGMRRECQPSVLWRTSKDGLLGIFFKNVLKKKSERKYC